MSTNKKVARKKIDPWADIAEVKSTVTPEKVSENPEDGSPFGSITPLMQLIKGYREHIKKEPIPMNGRATAPDGTVYGYYMSDDVFQSACEYCESKNAFLDISMRTSANGNNLMVLQLVEIETSQRKKVVANLGNPSTIADFGARITYAPKYLVAMMFGVSVQTDRDAFNNGNTNTNEPRQHKSVANTTDDNPDSSNANSSAVSGAQNSGSDVSSSNSVSNNSVDSNRSSQGGEIEHSKSYPIAKQFIERALTLDMLNTAESKVVNAKQLTDSEREELAKLINEKRKTVK